MNVRSLAGTLASLVVLAPLAGGAASRGQTPGKVGEGRANATKETPDPRPAEVSRNIDEMLKDLPADVRDRAAEDVRKLREKVVGDVERTGQGPVPLSEAESRDLTKAKGRSFPADGDVLGTPTWETPAWVRDSVWYQLDVPRFRNGDKPNDPPGTLPWEAKLCLGDPPGIPAEKHLGGDLQGLASKLEYLKKLGVNTLYLTGVFKGGGEPRGICDIRHVDDTLGVAGSASQLQGETAARQTWKFSTTDRMFLKFIEDAHRQGFRVVLEICCGLDPPKSEEAVSLPVEMYDLSLRWMDPNGDGDPADGVDGWGGVGFADKQRVQWRRLVHGANPEAVLVCARGECQGLDVAIGYDIGHTIQQFFAGAMMDGTNVFRLIDEHRQRLDGGRVELIAPLGGWLGDHSLPGFRINAGKSVDDALDRMRLAMVFQHFYAGSPITLAGDEVGMPRGPAVSRMWWNDLPDPGSKAPDYRGDLLALVRFLNAQRAQHAPLRYGDTEPLLFDGDKKVLAFARCLPGDKVVLVMNYGDTNQQIKLAVAAPGQLVRVINPQLKYKPRRRRGQAASQTYDHTKVPKLRVGGSRQYANEWGEIALWVEPMSIRIALVNAGG
ncbi:MAG: hypothetical protein JSU63_02555 [Phycisphaerales bacterium]|nr:MAG: hypothetical protein JSU63_02555 [Phycisphaerales bacterium]